MIEARIECLCGQIRLPDLSLALVRGQILHMDATKARASRDLQRAWQAKAVGIKYVERYRERREAPVVPPPHPLAPKGMVAAPPEPLEERTHDILLVDPGEIAARVVEELGRNPVNEKVSIEVGRQLQALEDRLVRRVTQGVIEALAAKGSNAVAVPLPRGNLASVTPAPVPGGDVPVFVPSKIGDDGLQATVALETKAADEGSVSDAAAALREARKAGKQRRSTDG